MTTPTTDQNTEYCIDAPDTRNSIEPINTSMSISQQMAVDAALIYRRISKGNAVRPEDRKFFLSWLACQSQRVQKRFTI